MNVIEDIFNRMDRWRHLPNYQLERRADLFFAAYLRVALSEKYGTDLGEEVIPEFPVHIGTIHPGARTNKSFKIDYVAFAGDNSEAFLVELKTDQGSRRDEQDSYLHVAADVGMTRLIEGLVKIFRATKAKRKYFHLFRLLETAGLVRLPDALQDRAFAGNMRGVNAMVSEIEIIKNIPRCRIVYLQPTGAGEGVLTFEEFAGIIGRFDDPVTQRFIQSLRRWASVPAGDRKPT